MKAQKSLAAVLLLCLVLVVQGCWGKGKKNEPPTLTSCCPEEPDFAMTTGSVQELSVAVTDPDGDPLSYVWKATAGKVKSKGEGTALYTAPDQPCGAEVIVAVGDGKGGVTSHTWNVTIVRPENPPVIESYTPSQTEFSVNVGSVTDFSVVVSDPDGDPLSYSWEATEGTLEAVDSSAQWTAPSEPGSAVITVTVSDSRGGVAAQAWDVVITAQSPIIEGFSPEQEELTVYVGTVTDFSVAASDPDGDPLSYSWEATAGTLEAEDSSTAKWTAPDQPGSAAVTVTVSDGKGGYASRTWNVTVINRSPVISAHVPAEDALTANAGSVIEFSITASDPDGDSLSYAWEATNGTLEAEDSGTAKWTAPRRLGDAVVTVTVSDGKGGTANRTWSVTVTARSPVINSYVPAKDSLTVNVGSSLDFSVSASDPDGDPLSYSWKATGGTLDAAGRTAKWTAPNEPGSVAVTVTVSDGKGSSVNQTWNITVVVRPPVITEHVPSDDNFQVNVGSVIDFHVTASDPDGDPLSFTWEATGGAFQSKHRDRAEWAAPSQAGHVRVKVTVSDGKGGSATQTWHIEVTARPPEITAHTPVDDELTVVLGEVVEFSVSVSDPDKDSLSYTWEATVGTFDDDKSDRTKWTAPMEPGTAEVTVTVSDGKGGAVAQTWSVTVKNRSPVISAFVPDKDTFWVNEGDVVNFSVTASDPDGDSLGYTWEAKGGTLEDGGSSAETKWTAPMEPGPAEVTVTVSDGKGGTVTKTWHITVNAPPEIAAHSPVDDDLLVLVGHVVNFSVTASDPDEDTLSYTWDAKGGTLEDGDSSAAKKWTAPMETGSAEVTVTVSDGRGRTASQTWNITITVQPPEITNPLPASSSEKPYRAQISGEYDLSITAEDPQDLPLTFTWTATGGALQDHPLETAKWTAPSEMGLAKVTVTVKNTFNLSSTHTWYFDVTNIVDVDEDITQPTTWLDGMVYEIRQDIEVKSTLTVQPGAIVKFADGCGLRIDSTGQIIAQGTAEKAIVFTSLNDDSHDGESNQNSGPAAAGAWGGVILNSNGNVFEHCEFYYGGSSDGTMLDLGATSGNTVTNCTFAYSEGVGLYAGQASGATITNNAFYGNYAPLVISVKLSLDDSNVFEPPSGGDANTRQGIFVSDAFGATFFDEAIEWGETEVAFVLAPGSDFYIERGTLKLYPGTTVKLSGNSLRVLTIGELTAVGTDAKPIVFTSINDDEYGGRSGCPYPPAAPQPGDWATIEIALHAGRCVFANCRIRYGGTEADYSNGDAALSVSSNDVGLGKIVFEYNLRGLDYLAYQAELDCSFSYNTYPARISMEVHTISVSASENTYNAVYLCDRPQAGGDKMWRTNCPLVLLDSIDLDGSTVHHEPGTIIKAGRDVTIRLGLGAGSISSTSLPSPRIWTKTTEAMWAWEKGRLQRATGKASTIKKRVYGFRAATFITPNTPNDRSLGQFLKAGAVRALCRAASAAWGRSLIDSQGYVCDNTK